MLPIPWCDLKVGYPRTEQGRNQARKNDSLLEGKKGHTEDKHLSLT